MSSTNQEKGYIIKLYKRLEPRKQLESGTLFNAMAFMGFDGVVHMGVNKFMKYQNVTKFNEDKDEFDRILYHIRQKIFLYRLSHIDPADIFADDPEKPAMAIVFVDINQSVIRNGVAVGIISTHIYNVIRDLNLADFTYEVFGTLCSSDFVIAMKSTNMSNIFKIIYVLRSICCVIQHGDNQSEEVPLVRSTYSIPCYAPGNIDKLQTNEDLGVSIMLSLSDAYQPDTVVDSIYEGLSKDKEAFYSFGKFDVGLSADIMDMPALFRQYTGDGSLSPSNNNLNKYIHNTSTHFHMKKAVQDKWKDSIAKLAPLNAERKDSFEQQQYTKAYTLSELEKTIRTMGNDKNNESLPRTIVSSIIRLLLRAYQAFYSSWDYCEDVAHTIVHFGDAIIGEKFKDSDGKIDENRIILTIDSLNTLLDNRIIDSKRNFEAPQSNIRFTASSAKILVAYAHLLNKIYGAFTTETRRFYTYVTADIINEITATEFVDIYDPKYKTTHSLLNYSIPFNTMYNPYMICFMLHEIGHGIYHCIDRSVRNLSFVRVALINAIEITYHKHINNNNHIFVRSNEIFVDLFSADETTEVLDTLCDERFCPDLKKKENTVNIKNKKCPREFSKCPLRSIDCMETIFNYVKTRLLGDGENEHRKKIRDNLFVFLDYYKSLLSQIKTAYSEATADVFMIEMLGITEYDQYIDIIAKYLEDRKKNWSELSVGHGYRVMSVLLMLCDVDIDSITVSTIDSIINNLKNEFAKNYLREEYCVGKKYPIPLELCCFLKNYVWKTLISERSNNDSLSKLRATLTDVYKKVSKPDPEAKVSKPDPEAPEAFDASIDFITKFYYNR